MSILIQAGHRSSFADVIMQKLYERGLSQPSNSFTHHMTAQQVADKLYKIVSRESVPSANNKLADNVMVDLLLSNLDAQNWGWSADKNLFAMNLWQQLEPEAKFILVFDHPSHLLEQPLSADITVEIIDQFMAEWVEYHQKMLEILETHEDKAVLIEGSCAADNISKLGEQVKSIANDLQLKSHWQIAQEVTDAARDNTTDAVNQKSAATDHINSEILKKYPEVIKLFNTLLNKAVIKSSEPIYRTKQAELSELVTALNSLDNKQASGQNLAEKELLIEQLHHVQEQLEEAELAQQAVEKQAADYQKSIRDYESKIEQLSKNNQNSVNIINEYNSTESLKQENEVLIKQLHYTQEELEKCYLKSQSLAPTKEIRQPQASTQQPSKAMIYYGAAERVKNDLPYRLGSKMVKAKKPKDLAFLPLTLVKEYRDFRNFEKNQVNLPDIEEYKDVKEAKKVKNHLSYQLGTILVEGLQSPKKMVRTPLEISKKVILFKK